MKYRQALLALAVGAALVAAPLGMHAGPAHAKQITIGFANEATVAAFQTNVQNGMTKYARQAGYKLISLNNNYDDATALRNAQILANDKVDLAVEFQVDAKIAPAIAATFRKAHIPTISIDIPQPGAVFFGANNFGDGVLTGKALGRYIKSHGWPLTKVTEVLLALPEAGAIPQLRMDGIDYGIRQVVPGLPRKALIEQDGKGTIGDSQKVMANILPGIPKGNHIVVSAINDPSLLGAVRATQLAGRDSMAVYAGQNADPTGLDQIRTNPRWIGDAAYFPEFYGYYIIKLATKMLNHQKVSPYVFIPRLFLSKSNISTYYPGKATVAVRFPPGGLVFSNKPKLKP